MSKVWIKWFEKGFHFWLSQKSVQKSFINPVLYPLRVLVDLVHHRKSAKTRIIKRKQCLLHLHLALGPVVSSPKISEVKVLYQRMRNRCVWTPETLCKSSWKTLVPNASLKDFSVTSECPGSLGTAVHMVVTLTSAEESLFNVLLALLE